jgi:hypothetical protein
MWFATTRWLIGSGVWRARVGSAVRHTVWHRRGAALLQASDNVGLENVGFGRYFAWPKRGETDDRSSQSKSSVNMNGMGIRKP